MGLNRLKGQRGYLAGPIDCIRLDKEATQWREDITPFLQNLGVEVFCPIHKPTLRGVEGSNNRKLTDEWLANKEYDKLTAKTKEIIKVDLRLVSLSSFTIVNFDQSDHIRLNGTIHEMVLASQCRQNVFLVCEQGIEKIAKWWWGLLQWPLFFNSFDDLKQMLIDIDSANETRFDDKFIFFDKQPEMYEMTFQHLEKPIAINKNDYSSLKF